MDSEHDSSTEWPAGGRQSVKQKRIFDDGRHYCQVTPQVSARPGEDGSGFVRDLMSVVQIR